MTLSNLLHKTVRIKRSSISKTLSLIPELLAHHPGGSFHLVDDPLKLQRTSIVGMFVLRPAKNKCTSTHYDQLFGDYDWTYNIKGLDGGRLISNNNSVDAYRLAFQYGLSDAVIIGSNLVSTEGVDTNQFRGYLWQPYEVCSWNHLFSIDPDLGSKLKTQRVQWQQQNYLSKREYPAQIVFTWSGERKADSNDFLAGRVFHDVLPNGERVEAYIMTSELGARNIVQRAAEFGLADRIDDMLIILPPASDLNDSVVKTEGPSAEMNLSLVPKLLFEKYDIRIANHDGGQGVLLAFARAGILSQLNLTLCKQKSVLDVLSDCEVYDQKSIEATDYQNAELFEHHIQYFFSNFVPSKADDFVPYNVNNFVKDIVTNIKPTVGDFPHSLPRNLEVVSVLEDTKGEVAIVTLKTNYKFDFCIA